MCQFNTESIASVRLSDLKLCNCELIFNKVKTRTEQILFTIRDTNLTQHFQGGNWFKKWFKEGKSTF